jgi:hypothetical protein
MTVTRSRTWERRSARSPVSGFSPPVAAEHPLAPHEIAQRQVAVIGHHFLGEDVGIDVQVGVGRVDAQSVQDAPHLLRAVGPAYQIDRDQGAGVDHRVERPPVDIVKGDRVERITAWLDPDAA